MKKILIIGGGWGGLSVAHQLKGHDVTVLEKNTFLGGQAASQISKLCHVEYSWRVFFTGYKYTKKIIKDLKIKTNFYPLGKVCISKEGQCIMLDQLNKLSMRSIMKLFGLSWYSLIRLRWFMLLPDWALMLYRNVSFIDYFGPNPFLIMIAGPILGQEPTKVSLPQVIKTIRHLAKGNRVKLDQQKWQVTSGPPDVSIFQPWKKYLTKQGVKFFLGKAGTVCSIQSVKGRWQIKTMPKIFMVDKLIISCSLKAAIKLLRKYQKFPTIKKLSSLVPCLQVYVSINFYFTKKMNNLPNSFILIDQPWQPIIEIKRWGKPMKDCNKKIKEVWNVGVFDLVRGKKCKKFLRNCSLVEAIRETVYQVQTDALIRKKIPHFSSIFWKAEVFPYWKTKKGKVWTSNPKFSINAGYSSQLIDSFPSDKGFPPNLYFAAYYCKAKVAGVSMERSCQIGTDCGKRIKDLNN